MSGDWKSLADKLPEIGSKVDVLEEDGFVHEGLVFVGDSFDDEKNQVALPLYEFFKWRKSS